MLDKLSKPRELILTLMVEEGRSELLELV